VTALLLIVVVHGHGSPPFSLISEFTILTAAFTTGHQWIAAVTILFLVIIFVGIAAMILEIAFGVPKSAPSDARAEKPAGERTWLVVAPAALAALVLLLGIYIPSPLARARGRRPHSGDTRREREYRCH
jgi:formate hydrogenlyase subunit 3/multisubunit Na+/H+ antiporter MnhD subunit